MKHHVIAFANHKGGVGKTTTCINLAGALSEKGKSILLVDMDFQCNLSLGVGAELDDDVKGMADVMLFPRVSLREVIQESSMPNVDIAPGNDTLANVDINIDRIPERQKILHDKLYEVKNNYDYVFLDCGPAFNLLMVNALTASDGVLIPIKCQSYALQGMNKLLEKIDDIRYSYNFDLEITGFIANEYDTNTRMAEETVSELHERFAGKVYDTIIRKCTKISELPLHQQPMVQYARSHPVAHAYRDLAEEFLRRESP